MRTKHVIYASVLVAGLGIASPSFAQGDHGGSSSSPSSSLDATLTAVKTQANGTATPSSITRPTRAIRCR